MGREAPNAREDADAKETSPDVLYALGYVLYMHPRKHQSPEHRARIVQVLKHAIALASRHNMAKLYLGHFLYDSGMYEDAREQLRLVERETLDPYQKLKVHELELSAAMHIDGIANHLNDLTAFVDECIASVWFDVFPAQLVQTATTLLPIESDQRSARVAVRDIQRLLI